MPDQQQSSQAPETPQAPQAPVFSVPLPTRTERRRLEEILVRMPHEDKEAVKRLAAEAGMSLSAWCCAVIQSVLRQAEGGGKA